MWTWSFAAGYEYEGLMSTSMDHDREAQRLVGLRRRCANLAWSHPRGSLGCLMSSAGVASLDRHTASLAGSTGRPAWNRSGWLAGMASSTMGRLGFLKIWGDHEAVSLAAHRFELTYSILNGVWSFSIGSMQHASVASCSFFLNCIATSHSITKSRELRRIGGRHSS